MDKTRPPLLRNTVYGTLALPRLLLVLNSLYARDKNARVVVLSLRRHGLKQAKSLFNKLYKKEGDERTELQKALNAWLCSSQPRRLKGCKKCRRFFFDRSRRNSNQQCDGCRVESVTEEQSADRFTAPNILTRKLPPVEELEGMLSLRHDSEPTHSVSKFLPNGDKEYAVNDYLVNSCKECGHLPRTFLMSFWWVQSRNNLWKDLVGDLPVPLQESFNARWRESSRNLTGRRRAALALAWCIREADHWQALSRESFVRQTQDWSNNMGITAWEFLDLTYLPPYDLSFLMKVSKTAHGSSRKRKHASAYWGRGGITRYDGSPTSQGFWTACAGPLAVRIRPHMKGKSWDSKTAIPRVLWQQIIALWQLRYPDRDLPSPEALRRRVSSSFIL